MIRFKSVLLVSATIFWTFSPYTEAFGVRGGSAKLRSKNSNPVHHKVIKGERKRQSHQSKKLLPAENVFEGLCLDWNNPCTYIFLGLMVTTGMIGSCQAIQSGSTPLRTDPPAPGQNSTSWSNSSYTLAPQPSSSSMTWIPEACSTELCFTPSEVFDLFSRSYTLAPQPSSSCTIEATSPSSACSETEQCFVHPGVCALPTNYTDEDVINQAALEILEGSSAQMQTEMEAGDYSSLVALFQERFRVGVVDGELLPTPILQAAAEATRWREALKYVDEEIIPNPIEGTPFEIFEKHLFKLNSILTGNSGENTYRSNPMLIAKLPISSPRFQHTERMKDFLTEHSLHFSTYSALIPTVDKVIQEFVSKGLIQNDDEGKKGVWEEIVTAIFKKNTSFYTPERYSLCAEYYDFDNSSPKVLRKKMRLGYEKAVSFLQEGKTFEAAGILHQAVTGGHVCPDGNGRTSRVIALGLLKQKKLPLPVFWSEEAYTRAVRMAFESGDDMYFAEYLKQEACRSQSLRKVGKEQKLTAALRKCKAPSCQRDFDEGLAEIGVFQ